MLSNDLCNPEEVTFSFSLPFPNTIQGIRKEAISQKVLGIKKSKSFMLLRHLEYQFWSFRSDSWLEFEGPT